MLDIDPTPGGAVDLVVGDADESWEDLVRDLIAGPADPSRILTDCGGNGCTCMSGGNWRCASGSGNGCC